MLFFPNSSIGCSLARTVLIAVQRLILTEGNLRVTGWSENEYLKLEYTSENKQSKTSMINFCVNSANRQGMFLKNISSNYFKSYIFKQLLVFSVTPFKIDQNKKSKPFNRLSPESGNRKKLHMHRLSPRLRSQQFFSWKICEETFSPNL